MAEEVIKPAISTQPVHQSTLIVYLPCKSGDIQKNVSNSKNINTGSLNDRLIKRFDDPTYY